MRRQRRQTRKVEVSCHVNKILFEVQEDRQLGRATLEYERFFQDQSFLLQAVFRVRSLWMEPQKGNAIKAHLECDLNNPTHRAFLADCQKLGIIHSVDGFGLMTDGRWLRYAIRDSQYRTHDPDTYVDLTYYDSKAKALSEAIAEVGRYQTIGGLNRVSFNRVPDQVLLEAGFEKVPDLMRTPAKIPVGVPMWKGTVSKLFSGSSYGSEAARSRKQFLELIGKTINAPLA